MGIKKWNRLIALCLLLLSPEAWAGSLHYDYLELRNVPAQAGYALVVLVTAVDAARRSLRVRIQKHWGTLPESLRSAGEVAVQLNPGVEWLDPHESPIEHRVRGFLRAVEPTAEIVLVPLGGVYEALPGTPAMKRKMDLFFAPTGLPEYKKSAPIQELVRDLQDEDLALLAYDALRERKLLRAEHLLSLPPHELRLRVSHHLGHATSPERSEFLRATAMYFSGKPYEERTRQILSLLYDAPLTPSDLPPLAALLDALDLDSEKATGDFSLLKDRLVERLKAPDGKEPAALFVRTMVRFALHRPPYRSDDPGTLTFLGLLDRSARIRMVRELLAGLNQKPRFDAWIYDTAMPFAAETPSRDYLPELAALDLTRIDAINRKTEALVRLVRLALRIVETDPRATSDVRRAIDPKCKDEAVLRYLALTSPEGKALLERYQALAPAR